MGKNVKDFEYKSLKGFRKMTFVMTATEAFFFTNDMDRNKLEYLLLFFIDVNVFRGHFKWNVGGGGGATTLRGF